MYAHVHLLSDIVFLCSSAECCHMLLVTSKYMMITLFLFTTLYMFEGFYGDVCCIYTVSVHCTHVNVLCDALIKISFMLSRTPSFLA